jgi:hypothetical protein
MKQHHRPNFPHIGGGGSVMSFEVWAAQPGTGGNTRGMDFSDALVNKPDNAAAILTMYGALWSDKCPVNALSRLMIYARQRQYDTWDWELDMPSEHIAGPAPSSCLFAQYNQWTHNDDTGNYIIDALEHDLSNAPTIAPGQPGYRVGPWNPKYAGPYWTRTTTG